MNTYKFNNERQIYQSKMFKVSKYDIELSDGRKIERDIVHHPGAVVILARDHKNYIYFIKQYRFAIRQELLELPAGCLEPGEAVLDCAKRELQEEIGFAANKWQELGIIYPAPGFCDEVQYLFLAEDLFASQLPLDEDEVMEVVKYNPAEIKNLIATGKILDAKTLAVLTLAQV